MPAGTASETENFEQLTPRQNVQRLAGKLGHGRFRQVAMIPLGRRWPAAWVHQFSIRGRMFEANIIAAVMNIRGLAGAVGAKSLIRIYATQAATHSYS